jgi:hypothetical protein
MGIAGILDIYIPISYEERTITKAKQNNAEQCKA